MLLKNISKKLSYVGATLVLMTAQVTPFFVFTPKAGADGNGSPVECLDSTANVVGSIEGTDDQVIYNAGVGNVVDGVCIKSGKAAIDGEKHSGVLGNGSYENGCYTVTGVGTQTVTVTRTGSGNDCKGISHIDAVIKPVVNSIKVIKDSQPNSSDDFDFTIKKGQSTVSSFELEDDGDNNDGKTDNYTKNDLSAGTYVVTESPEESGWVLYDIVCSGGVNLTKDVANKKVTIVLASSENVICTFINKPAPQYGQVKVNKMVDTDGNGTYDGGNTTANSIGFTWGLNNEPLDNNMGSSQSNVPVGSNTVNEHSLDGYQFTGWYYTANFDDRGDYQENCNYPRGTTLPVEITVEKNKTKEITLCNKKLPKGTLVLIKEVKNDNGGSASQNAWTLNANGPENVSGVDSTDSTDTGYSKDVTPGMYSLSETNGPAGYELDYVKCRIDNGNWTTLNSNQQIEVKKDKITKCIFKNDDIAPSLTLVKEVVNSNKPASSWKLTANGDRQDSTDLSGNGLASSGSNFKADTYTLGESGPSGFDASPWSCTNGVTVNGNNQITLGLGQNTTCTIVNTAKPVTVVATKIVCDKESLLPNWGTGANTGQINSMTAVDWVTNNSGCKLTQGWNFEYAFNNAANPGDNLGDTVWTDFGPTNVDGVTSAQITDLSNVNRIWVREQLKSGYLGFTYNIAGNNNNDVSAEIYCNKDVLNYDNYDFIDNPEYDSTYYCVAWNVENAVIRVHKNVVNDNGGDKDEEDFEFKLNDNEKQNFAPEGEYVEFTVLPGEHLVTEIPVDGYSVSYQGCDIEAEAGQTYNCYVTNNDKAGKVTIKKQTSVESEEEFKFTDTNGNFGISDGGSKVSDNLSAGTFTTTENVPEGWKLLPVQCTGSETWTQIENGVSINVASGDDVTCIFYNQKLSSISGYKLNDENGNAVKDEGEKLLPNWTIELYERCDVREEVSAFLNVIDDAIVEDEDCYELVDTTLTDEDGNYTFSNLESGYYKVCEVEQEGWTRIFPADSRCHEEKFVNEDCVFDFANKADEEEPSTPGVVLGTSTPAPKPPVLASTGQNTTLETIVGMLLIGGALLVTVSQRKSLTKTTI